MAVVEVNLGKDSYNIHIGAGILSELGQLMRQFAFTTKALVVSDENVGAIYGAVVVETLRQAGFSPRLVCVKPGETAKAYETAMTLYTAAIEEGLDRRSPIVALGGGVVGDLAGFVAATYLRGVPFIQVPTSLLAQVDSSVGGKVAINHPLGKNLIGAFYQPQLVVIDTAVLATLPRRELYAGLAEVIKYGLIADRDFFHYINEKSNAILAMDNNVLTAIVSRSCRIKADIVEQDARESALRMVLNFGHTIAHAIEAGTGFAQFNHGEAVAIGMRGAALVSHYMGIAEPEVVENVCGTIRRFHLPLSVAGCSAAKLHSYLLHDKKVIGGKINWILLRSVGEVQVHSDVPEQIVSRVLAEIT